MKCSKLRRLLADHGPKGLAGNQKAEDHLVACAECYAVLEAMAEVDRLLPALEIHDVADEVVDQLLARPELKTPPGAGVAGAAGRFARARARLNTVSPLLARIHPLQWLGGVLDRARQTRLRWGFVAVPAVLLIGFISVVTMRSADDATNPQEIFAVKKVKTKPSGAEAEEQTKTNMREENERLSRQAADIAGERGADEAGRGGDIRQRIKGQIKSMNGPNPATRSVPIPDPTPEEPESLRGAGAEVSVGGSFGLVSDDNLVLGVPDAPPPPEPLAIADAFADEDRRDLGPESDVEVFTNKAETSSETTAGSDKDGVLRKSNHVQSNEKSVVQNRAATRELDEFRRKLNNLEAQVVALRDLGDDENADLLEGQLPELKKRLEDAEVAGGKRDSSSVSAPVRSQPSVVDDDALAAARRFLAARNQVEGLSFREARGYWANTYVPGDRTLRQLKARLDRAAGAGATGTLHDGSRQISQPFDAPNTAALAVYLHGDRRGVETRERMLVQIGLKGTPRRSGVRPNMNVGLVLDLRGEIDTDTAASMRALLAAFASSAELGDRFSLTVAGRPGGTILPPGDLRHGPLTVAMAELFGDDASGEVLSLDQAVAGKSVVYHLAGVSGALRVAQYYRVNERGTGNVAAVRSGVASWTVKSVIRSFLTRPPRRRLPAGRGPGSAATADPLFGRMLTSVPVR